MKFFYKLNDILMKIEEVLLALFTVSMIVSIAWQVICRYFLFIATPWAEELARYSFIWSSFIGAGYMTSKNGHITIDLSDSYIKKMENPEKVSRIQSRIGWILSVIFLIVLCVFYWKWLVAFKSFSRLTPGMRINMGVVRLGPLIGMALVIYHGLFSCVFPKDIVEHDEPDI